MYSFPISQRFRTDFFLQEPRECHQIAVAIYKKAIWLWRQWRGHTYGQLHGSSCVLKRLFTPMAQRSMADGTTKTIDGVTRWRAIKYPSWRPNKLYMNYFTLCATVVSIHKLPSFGRQVLLMTDVEGHRERVKLHCQVSLVYFRIGVPFMIGGKFTPLR